MHLIHAPQFNQSNQDVDMLLTDVSSDAAQVTTFLHSQHGLPPRLFPPFVTAPLQAISPLAEGFYLDYTQVKLGLPAGLSVA